MGALPAELARELKARLRLTRAIETGTYKGGSARLLAEIFEQVVTIELSPELYESASRALARFPGVTALQGDSREQLGPLAAEEVPTLYWLDGHWSGGPTAGHESECPLLEEIAAIGAGTADDCILIDDARLFAVAPPPPHDPAQWPTLLEVIEALQAERPDHHITLVHDLVIAVPASVKDAVDRFGWTTPHAPRARDAVASLIGRAVARPLDLAAPMIRRLRRTNHGSRLKR